MTPPVKSGNVGTQGVQIEGINNMHVPAPAASPTAALLDYILRFLAVALTLVAAITMGVAKQTREIVSDGELYVGTLKSSHSSAFKYFIAANAIACVYGAVSLALSVVTRGGSRKLASVLAVIDVVMVAFLFSGNGAASAIGVVARNGVGELWPKVCGIFGKFCRQITASIILSMFAAIAYLALVMLSILGLHKRST